MEIYSFLVLEFNFDFPLIKSEFSSLFQTESTYNTYIFCPSKIYSLPKIFISNTNLMD